MKKISLCFIMLVSVCLFMVNSVHATSIAFAAVDLPDPISGEDLWQYSYSASGFMFDAGYGFTVYFDENHYAELANPTAGTDWDPIFWEPNLALLVPGAYDALALIDGASLAEAFTIDFVWLGSGAPGAQLFEVYEFNEAGEFAILEEGQTVAAIPVPEPATGLLLGLAVTAVIIARKRRMVLGRGNRE